MTTLKRSLFTLSLTITGYILIGDLTTSLGVAFIILSYHYGKSKD